MIPAKGSSQPRVREAVEEAMRPAVEDLWQAVLPMLLAEIAVEDPPAPTADELLAPLRRATGRPLRVL